MRDVWRVLDLNLGFERHRRCRFLPSAVAFADDQIVAEMQITLDDFSVGAIVETEID